MLVHLKEILLEAYQHGYAVPAFNVNNLETIKAVLAAAETERSPVILQTSEGAVAYAGMEMLVAMISTAAKKAMVPVAMHLDHGKSVKMMAAAIEAGYGSVMIDGSLLPYADNVAQTVEVVTLARSKGVSVEAELGAIAGVEDLVKVEERQAMFTDPKQAAKFVEATGCDALAVSIGTAHGAHKFKGVPELDLVRLAAINELVEVPLVLHGASGISEDLVEKTRHLCEQLQDCSRLTGANGVPDEAVMAAVSRGIRKVNIDSDLRVAFVAGLRDGLLSQPKEIDPRKLLALSVQLMTETARHKMQMLGSSGRV